MKKNKIIYLVFTGLFTAFMLMSISMYLFDHDNIATVFEKLGYPGYLVYGLAFAKIAGLATIWFLHNKRIKEWAYAGFFFDLVLAFFAHLMIGDGEQFPAVVAIILLGSSYYYGDKLSKE